MLHYLCVMFDETTNQNVAADISWSVYQVIYKWWRSVEYFSSGKQVEEERSWMISTLD